jgi:phospho-N-acetylmuramoyl-pentapeptide-transferase
MPPFIPVRPDLAWFSILGYGLFAFLLGLALTPWFVRFLRRNKLGKQLRVETVDGREASIFRKYHEKKFGTPTMGGLLIWGSIVLTVAFSRLLSYFGLVDVSLLQRGQVYLPLFTMLSLGILGAIDDYLNIVGANEEQWKKVLPKIRVSFFITILVLAAGIVLAWWGGLFQTLLAAPFEGRTQFGLIGLGALLALLIVALLFLGFSGALVDDILRRFVMREGKKRGLGVLPKISSLLLLSFIAAGWFYYKLQYDSVFIPYWGILTIGAWYIPMAMFIIVGTANAVNVTDGLDGLAGGLLVIAFASFGVLAYLSGLSILAAFCAITAAAIAAFLWHNVPPALFYMGDTGALALGGTLGVIALMMDQVVLLPLIGFVFVIEMLSVIIQLTSKKLRGGKKIFRAAPIHHHFEALEWGESKVTMRLWIIGAFCAVLGVIIALTGGFVTQKTQDDALPGPAVSVMMQTC